MPIDCRSWPGLFGRQFNLLDSHFSRSFYISIFKGPEEAVSCSRRVLCINIYAIMLALFLFVHFHFCLGVTLLPARDDLSNAMALSAVHFLPPFFIVNHRGHAKYEPINVVGCVIVMLS